MAYQSLYRRYRPQRFAEIRGQPHVVSALQNAVAKNEVGHAYLFHGPRGTGKTTSARVLAKALNCENLGDDAEPCGACESCVAIEEGRSFDLHELDAASNNGVDDMRDLLAKVSLGNPGRAKVYILDEVHMLTRGAENALLKTLEEPPDHVIWVLATTEPHKVVQTIRSRCQVFELGLLGAEEMAEHVRWVIDDAGLDVDAAAVDHVVTIGGGSVRDTLSALDRVVAAGGVVEIDASTDLLLSALADRDVTGALGAVGDAMGRGKDPRTIGETVLGGLRDAFLTAMDSPPPRLTAPEQMRAADIAGRMTPAELTRALETLGTAMVEMRQAPDPRVDLEVALVRLCRVDVDTSGDALVARIERLEAALAGGAAPAPAPMTEAPASVAEAPEALAATMPPPPAAPAAAAAPAPTRPAQWSGGRRSQGPRRRRRSGGRVRRFPGSERCCLGPYCPHPSCRGPDATGGWAARPSAGVSPSRRGARRETPRSPPRRRRAPGHGAARSGRRPSPGRRSRPALGRAGRRVRPGAAVVPGPHGRESHPRRAGPRGRDPAPEDPVLEDAGADDIDLTELVDAPARAEEVIERLTEAFPGAELHTPEESDQ